MKRRCVPIVLLFLLVPHTARAGDPMEDFPDPAAARNLLEEARALIQKKRYADACPKLEESLRLQADLGGALMLADCNEHIGKIATAWAGFLDVAAQSKAVEQPERERVARKRAFALEPRLPKLVIEVPKAEPGLEVRRDGMPVDSAGWGTAIPVDPGTHRVTAWAPGKQRWLTTVQSDERTTARVELPRDLAPIAEEPAPPEPAVTPPMTGAPPAPETSVLHTEDATPRPFDERLRASFPPPVIEEPLLNRTTIGWVTAGIGVASIGVGAVFGLASLDDRDASRSYCRGDVCNATGVSLRDDAIRNGNVATVSTMVGAAALLGGGILVLTAPKRTEAHRGVTALRAAPSYTQRGGGVVLGGSFR